MSAIAARVGRAVLAVAAVVFAVVAVGLVDNPRVPGWLIVGCALLAVFAACLWYLAREVRRAPLDRPRLRVERIPGVGVITGWQGTHCPDLDDVTVHPFDDRPPVHIGTLGERDWQHLRNAPDPRRFRARAQLVGGVR